MLKPVFSAHGLDTFKKALQQQPALAQRQLQRGLASSATALRAALEVATPKRTGATAAQWTQRAEGDGFTVENSSPIVPMLEFGTRPHVIRPRRRGGVLAFSVAGRRVFARQVNHPGTQPTHFVERTVARTLPRVVRIMAGHVGTLTRALKTGG